jgi:PAS domain S-box-containing protein
MSQADKQTLDSLQKQVESLRLTLDHVGAFVFTTDAQGRYTFANQMACDLLDRSLADIVGRRPADFFEAAPSDPLGLSYRRVLELGERDDLEERVVHKGFPEPREYWTVRMPLFLEQGAIAGMCIVSKDITDRRKLERQLEAQRQLLDAVLDNTEAFIYLKDEHLRYKYVNEKTAVLYGRDARDIVGKKKTQRYCPSQLPTDSMPWTVKFWKRAKKSQIRNRCVMPVARSTITGRSRCHSLLRRVG